MHNEKYTYSPETKGDLEEYLRTTAGPEMDNLFEGTEYFIIIKEKGLLEPGSTMFRVNNSPLPDVVYFVNDDYLLESRGGSSNMSTMDAKKGVYEPKEALEGNQWSIHGLKLEVLYKEFFDKRAKYLKDKEDKDE